MSLNGHGGGPTTPPTSGEEHHAHETPPFHRSLRARPRRSGAALNACLVGGFGVLALVIATIGIGGVLAFVVARRTREIGIRMSLGAHRGRVVRGVLADGVRLLGLGIALGLAGSVVVGRLLEGLLFGVAPGDPATLALTAGLMLGVGLVACALPARRAAGVDPMVAMREE